MDLPSSSHVQNAKLARESPVMKSAKQRGRQEPTLDLVVVEIKVAGTWRKLQCQSVRQAALHLLSPS